MIKYLGKDVYAILSLTLVVTGYFYLLDLGLGRGIVKYVAEYNGNAEESNVVKVIQTSFSVYGIMAISGALILWMITPFLVRRAFHVPIDLQKEAILAFYWTSIGLFFKILQILCASIITGYQRLRLLSVINIAVNSFRIGGTIILLLLGFSLIPIVMLNVVIGMIHFSILYFIANNIVPRKSLKISFSSEMAKCLVAFSSKAFVTDFAGIICINLDKLFISIFLPIKTLAYYTACFELASRIWMIPSVVTTAIFPSISEKAASGDERAAIRLYINASRLIFIGATFFSLVLFTFSYEILKIWIGKDFAEQGGVALQLLSIGVFVSSLGWAAVTLANGFGRPEIPAKIHSFAAAMNVFLCLYLIPRLGISGAALAWLVEHIIAVSMILLIVNKRFADMSLFDYIKKIAFKPLLIGVISVFLLNSFLFRQIVTAKGLILSVGIIGMLYLGLNFVFSFSKKERAFLAGFIKKVVIT